MTNLWLAAVFKPSSLSKQYSKYGSLPCLISEGGYLCYLQDLNLTKTS